MDGGGIPPKSEYLYYVRYCQEKIVTVRNIYPRTSINNIPKMPRYYEKKEGTRRIMYRQDDIARAMIDVQEGMSIRAAATKNNTLEKVCP
ncbi:hypothetical protein Avbf_12430 [Armadillidium vulgare]|nr:hypothetical protein Avbf_12430 [Armadillidium vulgare]